jgi:hypothetical protein
MEQVNLGPTGLAAMLVAAVVPRAISLVGDPVCSAGLSGGRVLASLLIGIQAVRRLLCCPLVTWGLMVRL